MPFSTGPKAVKRFAVMVLAGAVLLPVGCDRTEEVTETSLEFRERSKAVGLDRVGQSYSAAAADFNRDGWPDLAVSKHSTVSLHSNRKGEYFRHVSGIGRFEQGDTHGVTWLDWNADGWPDLYVSRGADRGRIQRGNRLHLNRRGRAFELAGDLGVAGNGEGRGRSATPWDLNDDGRLDLMILNRYQADRPQRLALSGDDGYRDAARATGWDDLRAETVTALRLGGETVWVLSGNTRDAGRIYRRDEAGRFTDITWDIGVNVDPATTVAAAAVADVNNDGLEDLYLVRAPHQGQGAAVTGQGLEFHYSKDTTPDNAGLHFEAAGAFTLRAWAEGRIEHASLYLGPEARPADRGEVHVMPSNASLDGAPSLAEAEAGVYLWRTGPGAYELRYVPGPDGPREMTGRLVAVGNELELTGQYGHYESNHDAPNELYIQRDGRLHDVDEAADPRPGRDAVFADFDNDGDLDLYVLNGGALFENPPNRVYENRGGFDFADVTHLAGGTGSKRGRGTTVLTFDYNRDGRMDLFLTNGQGAPPRRHEGPYELFRNDSRAGNWLRVGLEATDSNPMALGARVVVQTVDGRQERFVGAATGALVTSWLPLHFGLGEADHARVTVHWPSGRIQRRQAQANELVTVTEPSGRAGR